MDEIFEATERTPTGGVEAEVAAVVDALARDPPTAPAADRHPRPGVAWFFAPARPVGKPPTSPWSPMIVRPGHAAYERLLKRTEPFPIRLDVPGLLD